MNRSEFLRSRKNYIGASDAPIILGLSPWMTVYELWRDKLGLSEEKPDTYAMKRGRDMEPVARAEYITQTGNFIEPKQVFHPEIPYMMANLDGLSEDGKIAVEIKCPMGKDHDLAKEGHIPEKYMAQVQHQLAVLGLDRMHYFSYKDGECVLVEVQRDDEFIANMIEEEKKFWDHVRTLNPPALSKDDYRDIEDDDWLDTASKWKSVNTQIADLKKQEEELREILLRDVRDTNVQGNGVRVQKTVRKGAVDYQKILTDYNVDTEKYRKTPVESWRITKYE